MTTEVTTEATPAVAAPQPRLVRLDQAISQVLDP